jgi:large-conductance mechanosensitive channel
MPSSGIIDLAIGLIFVFAVTAALSSAVTELVARLLGLQGLTC